ncbi:MAG: glycosyltransferase, partial [Acidobacteriota bacterium]
PGGAERSLAEMLPHFRRANIQPAVVCLARRREGIHPLVESRGTEVMLLAATSLVRQALALRKIILERRPDIVHTTLFRSDLAGRLAAMGRPVTVLSSLVSTDYDSARFRDPSVGRVRIRVTRLLDSWSARHLTDHFHAISGAVKAQAARPARNRRGDRGRRPAGPRKGPATPRSGLSGSCLPLDPGSFSSSPAAPAMTRRNWVDCARTLS